MVERAWALRLLAPPFLVVAALLIVGAAPPREIARPPESVAQDVVAGAFTVGPEVDPEAPVLGLSDFPVSAMVSSDGAGTTLYVWMTGTEVLASRVLTDSTVLDPEPIVVASPVTLLGRPDVAWNGSEWLVVWHEALTGGTGVRGTRVDGAGIVLDPGGLPIADGGELWCGRVAPSPTDWLLVCTDVAGDFVLTRLSRAGAIVDPAPVPIASTGGDPMSQVDDYHASYGDGALLVGWVSRAGRLWIVRLPLDGSPAPAPTLLSQFAAWMEPFSMAWAGGSWLVAWADGRVDDGAFLEHDIFVARVAGDGTVTDPSGIRLFSTRNEPSVVQVVADGEGDGWVVFYEQNTAYAKRVRSDGSVQPPSSPGLVVRFLQGVGWDGTHYMTVDGDTGSILANRLTTALDHADASSLPVSSFNIEVAPAAAFNGNAWLLTWLDSRALGDPATEPAVMGARLRADGTVLDPSPLRITRSEWAGVPAVAANGPDWMVVAPGRNGPWAHIVAADGTVGVPRDLDPQSGEFPPAVASNDVNWLAVWPNLLVNQTAVRAVRFGRDGTKLDASPFVVSTLGASDVVVAAKGDTFLVVWTSPPSAQPRAVYAARVTDSGTVLDPEGFRLCDQPASQERPQVAPTSDGWFVAWQDYRGGGDGATYGTRITREGVALDPSAMRLGAASEASLAFDGQTLTTAWLTPSRGRFSLLASRWSRTESPEAEGLTLVEPVHGGVHLVNFDAHAGMHLSPGAPGRLLVSYETYVGPRHQIKARIVDVAPFVPGGGGSSGGGAGEAGAAGDAGAGSGGVGTGGSSGRGGSSSLGGTSSGGVGGPGGEPPSEAGQGGDRPTTGGASGRSGDGGTRAGGRSGSAGSAGSAARPDPPDDEGGCGCRVPRRSPAPSLPGLTALALAALTLRRRALRTARDRMR